MVHLAGLNDKKKWAKKVLLDIEDTEASDMNAPRQTEANIGEEMQEIDENTSISVEDSLCTFVVGEESCESQQISPSVVATEGGEWCKFCARVYEALLALLVLVGPSLASQVENYMALKLQIVPIHLDVNQTSTLEVTYGSYFLLTDN